MLIFRRHEGKSQKRWLAVVTPVLTSTIARCVGGAKNVSLYYSQPQPSIGYSVSSLVTPATIMHTKTLCSTFPLLPAAPKKVKIRRCLTHHKITQHGQTERHQAWAHCSLRHASTECQWTGSRWAEILLSSATWRLRSEPNTKRHRCYCYCC